MGALYYMKEAEEKWDGKSQLIWVKSCDKKDNAKQIRPLRTHDLNLTGTRERFLTPRDIADRFDVTPAGVLGWISRGWLKATKVGVNWRVSEKDLLDFIHRSTNGELS